MMSIAYRFTIRWSWKMTPSCRKSSSRSPRVNRRLLSLLAEKSPTRYARARSCQTCLIEVLYEESVLLCAAGRDRGTTRASVFSASTAKGLSPRQPTKGVKRSLSNRLSRSRRLRCPPPMPEPLSRYRILDFNVSDVFIFRAL